MSSQDNRKLETQLVHGEIPLNPKPSRTASQIFRTPYLITILAKMYITMITYSRWHFDYKLASPLFAMLLFFLLLLLMLLFLLLLLAHILHAPFRPSPARRGSPRWPPPRSKGIRPSSGGPDRRLFEIRSYRVFWVAVRTCRCTPSYRV